MKAVGALKRGKKRTISTSEARKNFAAALQMVHEDGLIIGFDRYTESVAALVPLKAVYVLAGQSAKLTPRERAEIEQMAQLFLQTPPAAKAGRAKAVVKKVAKARVTARPRPPRSRR